MKRIIAAALAGLSLMVAPLAAWAGTTIKLGTLVPKGSPWHELIVDMAACWTKAADDSLKVRIYPGGIAGDEPDMVRKMRVGQLHAAALTGAGLAQIATEFQALQMAMMYRSIEEFNHVRDRLNGRMAAFLETKGAKLLGWSDGGWVHFFTKDPVVHPDDLKPLRIFTWAGDNELVEAWKDAGYRPVPLAATDIHTALQSGLIDAVPTTPVVALSYQWFGLAKHMTDLKWAPIIAGIVVSTRKWAQIPERFKPGIEACTRAMIDRLQDLSSAFDRDSIRVMEKHGLAVHAVPPDVVAEWERRARKAWQGFIGVTVPADLIVEVERIRDEYRSAQSTH
jgi:TRAP-type C4-dicarboxylate transport system substrate-binding protein